MFVKYLVSIGSNIMALLTTELCAYYMYYNQTLPTVQAPNCCASCVSEKCLVVWSTHAHNQKLPAHP